MNGSSRTYAWLYDPQYRLTNETITGTAPTGTVGYRYDAVGNRTNRTATVSGVTNQTFSYNTNDWLTSDVYDSNGNTRTNGSNTYFYDVENRLTNYNNGAATFVYNADGVRVSKTVGSTTTLYLVDDKNPTGYAQVLEELTVSGGVTNLTKVYTYGLDLIAQRDVSSGLRTFYGYDGSGNTRYLTITNATVSDTYVYDVYGITIASAGSTANSYRFGGEQYDSDLGLYYLRARYMNAGTGRFWTRDAVPGVQSDPLSLHRYLYAHNNPGNMNDPSGNEGDIISTTTAVSGSAGLATESAAVVSQLYARALFQITRAIINADKIIFWFEAGTAAVGAGLIVANGILGATASTLESLADMNEKVTRGYLNNTRAIPEGWSARGFALEQIGGQHLAEAYVGGNVNSIDVFEGKGNQIILGQFKSHAFDPKLPDLEGRYLSAWARDAEALAEADKFDLKGMTANGDKFFRPATPTPAKVLWTPIPENHAGILVRSSAVTTQLREIAVRTRTLIVPIPVRGWKK